MCVNNVGSGTGSYHGSVLSGPFDTKEDAENFLNNNQDLYKKCGE